ncbi:MAG: aminotransferase class V-fold PLP-dependent enzyme [Clostridiales bacterium]|nr:aminotransferase class V-fold PLP-dependent enzyme [Clostridiales bacterium]
MIYFDNAATSFPKPPSVIEAVTKALTSFGNPARGAHRFSLQAGRMIVEARMALAAFFGSSHSERVVFTKNITESLNLVLSGIQGHIITSQGEHNSVLRPLHRRGNYTAVPLDALGQVTVQAIKDAYTKDTTAIVLAHASNVTGNIAPIEDIGAFCKEKDLLFVLDTAQTAGLIPIDMKTLCIDALCFTGHKSLLGPQGIGGVLLSERFTPSPMIVGGTGSHSFDLNQPESMPDFLEAGTLNSPGILGLLAGIHYVQSQGMDVLLAQSNRLAELFLAGVKTLPGNRLYGNYTTKERMPIVTVNFASFPSEEIAFALEENYGIAVRAGIHCAPLLHAHFGTMEQGALRFSSSHTNTTKEVATAIAGLQNILATLV